MKGLQQIRSGLKRSSPVILAGLSIVGVAATSVMAVRATPKALKILEHERWKRYEDGADRHIDPLSRIEIVQLTWKCYIPAAAIGVSTILCIVGSNMLNRRNQASLTSAYAMLEQSYKQYRNAANTVYGEDADAQIMAEVAKDSYVSADGYYVYHPELDSKSEKIMFYDEYSKRYFTTTICAVLNAQYHLNRNLVLRGDASLNEYYEFLGLEKVGEDIGWTADNLITDGILWLDFENRYVKMEDGMECCIISILYPPEIYGIDE